MAGTPARRPTIRDVADLAGVSIKTVSRVVNQSPGVTAPMREKVERAVQELGYRPNVSAAALRRVDRSTRSIAVVMQDLGNDFSSRLLRALEHSEPLEDVALLTASLDEDPEREARVVRDLVAHQVDGLVLMPTLSDQTYLQAEVDAGLAVVCVDRRPRGLDVDAVTTDNWQGARVATRHLIAQGHRRIAYLGDLTSIESAQDRLAGYLDALRDAGLGEERIVVTGVRSAEDGLRAVDSLIERGERFTAVLTARNDLTIGALHALQRHGLHHRVALVGFDDMPLAALADPPLTVVRQDIDTIAAQAVARLALRVRGEGREVRDIVVPPTLVMRGSGEIPARR